jgi:hypothetical protein
VYIYLKNRRNAQKLFNDEGEPRPNDNIKEHWENMKHLITFESKQGEVVRDHAMQTLVSTPSHSGCGREVGGKGILVRKWVQSWILFVLLYQMFIELYMHVWFYWWHVICRKMNYLITLYIS